MTQQVPLEMILESQGLTCVAEVKVLLLDQRRIRVSAREALYVNTCCLSREVLNPLSQSGDPAVNFDQPSLLSATLLPTPTSHNIQTDRLPE